ncbi:hypothetical protein M1M99_03345 [Thermodesulfovibrionales bacterium]|nr:hypothetical protein [Thermodesulfovibrionales bacterium]MCL0061604.1 hypothetical protein [Thermodesulfovibrionales bacterium]
MGKQVGNGSAVKGMSILKYLTQRRKDIKIKMYSFLLLYFDGRNGEKA